MELFSVLKACFFVQLWLKNTNNSFQSGKSQNNYKKAGGKAGKHNDKDDKGHETQGGGKSHHNHHEKWAKKGGNKGGKHYKHEATD